MTGRIRSVKPEWLDDELMGAASDEARVLSVALILMADDYGNGRASIATIAAEAWRYQMERDDGSHAPEILARASRAFRELLAMRFVETYEVAKQRYFSIRNWAKHQRVDRPGKPRVPGPLEADSLKNPDTRETLANVSRDPREVLATDLRSGSPISDQDLPLTRERAREAPEPAGDGTPYRPPLAQGDPLYQPSFDLMHGFKSRFEKHMRAMWVGHKHNPHPSVPARWILDTARLRGVDPDMLQDFLLEQFFADEYAKTKSFPWALFANQLARYIPAAEVNAE